MPFLIFEVAADQADRVILYPADPRDGPVESNRVACGPAVQAAIALLSRCTLAELAYLKREGISAIQRKVAAEDRVRESLAREAARTGVVKVADVQREFEQAVAEELADGQWREDYGQGGEL